MFGGKRRSRRRACSSVSCSFGGKSVTPRTARFLPSARSSSEPVTRGPGPGTPTSSRRRWLSRHPCNRGSHFRSSGSQRLAAPSHPGGSGEQEAAVSVSSTESGSPSSRGPPAGVQAESAGPRAALRPKRGERRPGSWQGPSGLAALAPVSSASLAGGQPSASPRSPAELSESRMKLKLEVKAGGGPAGAEGPLPRLQLGPLASSGAGRPSVRVPLAPSPQVASPRGPGASGLSMGGRCPPTPSVPRAAPPGQPGGQSVPAPN